MLIEYRIKFETDGVTITQRVDPGDAVTNGDQAATSNALSPVAVSNQLPPAFQGGKGGKHADPRGKGGTAADPIGPGGTAADPLGPGGGPADPIGPGGRPAGSFPLVILGPVVIGGSASANQGQDGQQPNGKAKGASNAT